MTSLDPRNNLFEKFGWCHQHANQIGYLQHRPMVTASWSWALFMAKVLAGQLKGTNRGIDCSEFIKFLFKVSGFRDPTGRNYDDEGDTQDMYKFLPHLTDLSQIHLATLCLFTAPDLDLASQHITVVLKPNPEQHDNPLLGSHGGNNGPIEIYAQELLKYMPGREIIWLAVAKLL